MKVLRPQHSPRLIQKNLGSQTRDSAIVSRASGNSKWMHGGRAGKVVCAAHCFSHHVWATSFCFSGTKARVFFTFRDPGTKILDMSTTLSALTILLLVFSQGLRLPALTNESSLPKPIASPSFYKTSFDCTKVKDQSVEQAICENVELAKLDLEMATAYKKRLESVPMSQKSELVLEDRTSARICLV